jgi:hypothetical protein
MSNANDQPSSKTSQAELLREEYIRFTNENLTRTPERQEQLNQEIKELRANQSSVDLLSVIVRYNYEDGFYENYPLIVEDLVNKGKITL